MDSEAVKCNLRHFTIRAGMGYPHNYNFQIRRFEVVTFAQVAYLCWCYSFPHMYMYIHVHVYVGQWNQIESDC